MRWYVLFLGALGCGEASHATAEPLTPRPLASAPRVERTAVVVDAGVAPPAGAAPAPAAAAPAVHALERPAALRRFFDALTGLEDGSGSEDVRIMQLGDSHTAADWYTGVVRRLLQTRFGDGGRGFVAIGKPSKGYVQDGIRVGMTSEWAPEHARLVKGRLVGDGHYGLSGAAVQSTKPGGVAWVDVPESDRLEVAYVAQPSGGSFDLLVDGASVVRLATRATTPALRFRGLDVDLAPHHIEVRSADAGRVRILGAALDRKSRGVVLDSFGRDGARAANILHWGADHVAELLKWRAPALVVLAYGTNECGDKDITTAQYERDLAEVVGRIVRATPGASCLLLGPPDYVQYAPEGPQQHPRLAEVIAVQRRVADAAHCAFYDQVSAMGGAGAHAAWAQEIPPRARKDGVHFSRDGYTHLAGLFVDELVRAYTTHRAESAKKPAVAARGAQITGSRMPSPL